MIRIVLKNGNVVDWKKKQWTDYKYDGKCFSVVKKGLLIGVYNMDSVISITVNN